jgi:excisionase family DNA binding protein
MEITPNAGGGVPTARFMTGAELAALLRTNRQTIRYWRHIGYGPKGVKVGRHVLFGVTEVNAWLSSLDAPPTK